MSDMERTYTEAKAFEDRCSGVTQQETPDLQHMALNTGLGAMTRMLLETLFVLSPSRAQTAMVVARTVVTAMTFGYMVGSGQWTPDSEATNDEGPNGEGPLGPPPFNIS